MTEHVYWVLELSVNGTHEETVELMSEMSAATKEKESGALHYEWWTNDDQSVVHIFERYANSAATMQHLGNFGKHYADRFFTHFTPRRFTVYGNVDDATRKALQGAGATFMDGVGGFSRHG